MSLPCVYAMAALVSTTPALASASESQLAATPDPPAVASTVGPHIFDHQAEIGLWPFYSDWLNGNSTIATSSGDIHAQNSDWALDTLGAPYSAPCNSAGTNPKGGPSPTTVKLLNISYISAELWTVDEGLDFIDALSCNFPEALAYGTERPPFIHATHLDKTRVTAVLQTAIDIAQSYATRSGQTDAVFLKAIDAHSRELLAKVVQFFHLLKTF